MNLFNKITILLSKLITSKDVSPLLGDTVVTENTSLANLGFFGLALEWFGGIIYNFALNVVSFLLSLLDIIQLAIYRIMGIGINSATYAVIDMNNPILKFLTNDAVTRAFRIFFVIALVLIILYTVLAIILTEYRSATMGSENKKGRIAARSLRSILLLVLFPSLLLGGIILTNSLFAGFNSVFSDRVAYNSTLGTNLFVSSSTAANRYRQYANNNMRMPILFDFEDPYQDGSLHGYTTEELLTIYNGFQPLGKEYYSNFVLNDWDKFNESLVYKNNKFYNNSDFAGFEKFVVTPEQYQVMADFLDYAMINRVEFYIKNIKDEDIEWKYVDNAIFDKSSTTLKITYKDANDLVKDAETYTIEYTPSSTDMSTPISDAFDTISNILAIGDYKDNLFNIMNRDENSINVVYWETDNVYLKLSSNYKNNPNYVDKLLLYEFNRFDYNNTLDCTIDDLETGIFLPLMKMDKRAWRTDLQKYITTEILYVVEINGTYYKVYMPDEEHAIKDDFGDFCYEIVDPTPIQGLATCSNHPAHTDGDPYIDYHADLKPCYDANCMLEHFHITEKCTDHVDHADGIESDDNSYIYDYHRDGTICYNESCNDIHFHKADSHFSEINRCNESSHYALCSNKLTCGFDIHFKVEDGNYVVDNTNGTYHHFYSPYPECDGINCESHNHYHFDGSRYSICYDACYENHWHSDMMVCTNNNCTSDHYHAGEECPSPYCAEAKDGLCSNIHYHSDGVLCMTPETCGNDYHRHTAGVCDREHYHIDGTDCSGYNGCMESFHRHSNDWDCDDENCMNNHYHEDGAYCNDISCETTHLHDACDGCRLTHYYYVEPYYEECSITTCLKYHYHLSNDGKSYIDCDDELCTKTSHYHYIYPNDDNCVYIDELESPGYFKYVEIDTFADIKVEKLNGSFTTSTTIDGVEISKTSYYDDVLTKVIKQVNWPQKLMNDMQVIYDKINLNLLLTTGDWLTQLSQIIGSSMNNGWGNGTQMDENSSTFDTSLIHPIGLIISELFLNKVNEDRQSYFGEYEFTSSLDDQEIRSLLLAICGEDKYRQLSLQVEYFADMFNIYMEPVLEEIAYKENFELLDGELQSEQLFTYKAYLASILMSSTCIKYLFDSALAYVGVSNFSYNVLSNPDLVQSLYEYYYSTMSEIEKNNKYPTAPTIDFYVNVTISPNDFAMINKIANIDGGMDGCIDKLKEIVSKIKNDEEVNLDGWGEINTLLSYSDFDFAVPTGQYSYAEFVEKFMGIESFFTNIKQCDSTSTCNQLHYHTAHAICTEHSDHIDGTPYSDYHKDLTTACTNASCNETHYHTREICENHNEHVNNKSFTDYHEDGTICLDVDCGQSHFHVNNNIYIQCDSELCVKNHYHLDSKIKKSIQEYFNFGELVIEGIDVQGTIDKIINEQLLQYVKINVRVGDSSEIVNVVDSSYKLFEKLDSIYKNYLTNDKGTGIYNKILAEMQRNNETKNNPDFEYVIALEKYIKGQTERWDYMQASDYTKGFELVGKLNELIDTANEYINNIPSVGSSGIIGLAFAANSLDVLYDLVESQEKDPVDSSLDDGNNYIEGFKSRPSGVIMSLYNYAKQNCNLDKENPVNLLNYGLSDYIKILMEQANSTSIDPTYGYKNSTNVLLNIAQVFEEYLSNFSTTFNMNEDEIKESLKNKDFIDEHPITAVLSSTIGVSKYFTDLTSSCQDIAFVINDYIRTLEKIDILNKYYVTYAVSAYVSSHINTEFDVVVNSKHFTVGSAMSPGKLAEYILGAEAINEMGYKCSFVEDDYKGFVNFKEENTGGVKYYVLSDYLSYLNEFIIGFGETTTSIFNKTNFMNLSPNSIDELVITENDNLMVYVLDFLTQNNYLPVDILMARFGLEYILDSNNITGIKDKLGNEHSLGTTVADTVKVACKNTYTRTGITHDDLKKLYLNAIDYLFINETRKDIDFSNMTLKDLRTYTIDFLINYEALDSESTEQNQKRYLTLFYLACSDWTREDGNINGLSAHSASMAAVLKLAGLENRPDAELVGLEYSLNLDFDGVDEANGDLFVICTYDDEYHYYVPFMMCNKYNVKFDARSTSNMNRKIYGLNLVNEGTASSPVYSNWVTRYGYKNAVSEYYTLPEGVTNLSFDNETCFYPIIARGGFDSYGRPTAIRQIGENIQFYRETVVIQNASKIGLSVYYQSVENIYHPRGILASTVNAITKVFTGKSLTAHLVENIPRLAIEYSANLPYGLNESVIEDIDSGKIIMNYTFSGSSLKLNTVYEKFDINLLLLFLSVIVVFSFIFKALWGVIGRLLEIVTLYIIGPVAISSIALKFDEKDKDGNYVEKDGAMSGIYDQWKNQLISKVLLAFGYIFGLNIFYMLLPMVNGLQLFNDTSAFVDIPWGGKLPISLINTIASVFMVIALASAIIYAPKLLAKVMNFKEEAFSYGANIQTRVKNTFEEAKDFVSGQRAMDFVADQKQNLKNMIPGIALIEKGAQKIGQMRDKAKANDLKNAAKKAGIPPSQADNAAKAFYESLKQQKANKAKRKKDAAEARAKRNANRANWN